MSLFGFFRRRSLDAVEAVVIDVDLNGGYARPLPGRRSPYDHVDIPPRTLRRLGLRPGEIVQVRVDPVSLRTREVRRVFGEPVVR